MRYPTTVRCATAALLCLVYFGSTAPSRADTADQIRQAKDYEKEGRWLEACALYDEILAKDRAQPGVREAYRRCLRHFRQDRRHQDASLRQSVEPLTLSESLNLFEQVLKLVADNYVEKERLELTALVHEAIREVQNALNKPAFKKMHLARARDTDLEAFKTRLDYWLERKITTAAQARDVARDLGMGGIPLRLPCGVLALELACGLCNSLDEYSFYLAPSRMSHAQTAKKNKLVGIGVELSVADQRIEVSRVYRKSPAADAGLSKGDRIVRIDKQWIDPLNPEAAAEALTGEAGSKVKLEILPRGSNVAKTIEVERQAVLANSVEWQLVTEGENYFGYIAIHNFQESTAQEVKQAIEEIRGSGNAIRGLILDLRGNLGGLFKASVEVTELFIGEGVIVHTYSPLRELNQTIEAKNRSPNLWPMVVLIDADTASSAEVVAGALKDNKRATLMGQTTFGKGSLQRVYPLNRLPGGLRLTVAKFASPLRQLYSDRGITPDLPLALEADAVERAMQTLLPMTAMR